MKRDFCLLLATAALLSLPIASFGLPLVGNTSAAAILDECGKVLREPAQHASPQRYAAKCAGVTRGIPVELEGLDPSLVNIVSSSGIFGRSVAGQYCGRAFILGEFEKIRNENFAVPTRENEAVAKMSIHVTDIGDEESTWGGVSTSLALKIEITPLLVKEPGFSFFVSKTIEKADWDDKKAIPPSFFAALSSVVEEFLQQWETGAGPATLAKWHTPGKGIVPPSLDSLKWNTLQNIHFGTCTVNCNGYSSFRTRKWAAEQLAESARIKLGGIGKERVRVVYDEETYDKISHSWKLEFRTFTRTRTVLAFDKTTKRGVITGDIELMGKEAGEAAEELKSIVLKELPYYAGMVEKDKPLPEASVRFDNYSMDKTFDLITITFRLL